MTPHKTECGKDALKLLQTFEGVPLHTIPPLKEDGHPICPQDPQVESWQEDLLPGMTGTRSKHIL